MFRPNKMLTWLLGLAGASLVLAACAPAATPIPAPQPTATAMMDSGSGMDMSEMGAAPAVPAGMAYAEGQEIRFMHTEVSDPDIAKLLSDMMSSPVLLTPALAEAPEAMLAKVYVFSNGPKGMGPLGFQPDVFDNPPGTDGYSPLRALHVVTWKDETQARELKSAAEVLDAEENGELTIERKPVVINMPFVTWLGGQR